VLTWGEKVLTWGEKVLRERESEHLVNVLKNRRRSRTLT
jgi:hypothetical protein